MPPRLELFAIVLPFALVVTALVTFAGVRDGAALDQVVGPVPEQLHP